MPTVIKNQKSATFNFRVDSEEIEKFKTIAKENGATASEWFNKFVEQVVITGKLPLQDTDELKTELALEQLREEVYQGWKAIRNGDFITLDELEESMKEW